TREPAPEAGSQCSLHDRREDRVVEREAALDVSLAHLVGALETKSGEPGVYEHVGATRKLARGFVGELERLGAVVRHDSEPGEDARVRGLRGPRRAEV